MNRQLEQRIIHTRSVDTLSVRSTDLHISGYALKWGAYSTLLKQGSKRFKETFKRGAFTESLRNDDQFFFWSHDSSKVLGRTKSRTLRLYEDSVGLKFHLDLPDTSLGREAYELIRRRDITGISVGFVVEVDEWDDSYYQYSYRTVKKAKLKEISAVAWPAYRSSEVHVDTPMQLEDKKEDDTEELKAKIQILTML